MSEFAWKNLQRARFRIVFFAWCQILNDQKYNESLFDLKVLHRVSFWIKTLTTRQILKHEFYNASDFHSSFLQRLKLWVKSPKTCQIFLYTLYFTVLLYMVNSTGYHPLKFFRQYIFCIATLRLLRPICLLQINLWNTFHWNSFNQSERKNNLRGLWYRNNEEKQITI